MCTIMFYPETLPAEKRSVQDSQLEVDRLMEYDRTLSEDFTVEELRKLFIADEPRPETLRENYSALTDAEKTAVEALGFVPPEPRDDGLDSVGRKLDVLALRRYMKAKLIGRSRLLGNGLFGVCSNIYVWLDSMCFGNSKKTGFYYVRDSLSMLSGWSTAYAHPLLIVQKSKLRPDQIEYMEQKRRETSAAAREAQEREEA